MDPVIRVRDLTKEFGDFRAVDKLSFTVPQGEIYGFLGQNGAGKSTTIRMLLTLVKPSSGSIEILGMDLQKHRKEILRQTGAVIERPDLYKYLTALENIRLFASMSGIKPRQSQLMEQLEMVGLASRAHSKVRTYSQGMKQRLGIATALVHDPALIILDEPVNGLDPQGIADMRNLILHLSRHMKKTVLVSSHLLSEMELIADSMLIIDKGKKLAEGKVSELFDPSETIVVVETSDIEASWLAIAVSELQPFALEKKSDHILLKIHRNEQERIVAQLAAMNLGLRSFYSRNSLEDYFLSLTSANQHVDTFKA